MGGKRKYAGPLQPGKRSAKVSAPPKALQKKAVRRNYRASYKLSKPFKQVLNTFLDQDKTTHWVTHFIRDQLISPLPFLATAGPNGIFAITPKITQAGTTIVGGGSMPANLESRQDWRVKLKTLSVGLNLRMDPTWHIDDINAQAIRYKVLLLSCKKVPGDYNQMVNSYFGGYENQQFKDGAEATKWDKYMENFDNPVNSALFTVHDMKEGTLSRGMEENATTPGSIRIPPVIRNIHLKVKCKSKILKFDTPGSTLSANFQPFLWIGWKSYNGHDWISGLPGTVPGLLHATGAVRMSYDDMD